MTTTAVLEPQLVEMAREVARTKQCRVIHDGTGFPMAYSVSELAIMQKQGTVNEALKPVLLDSESALMLVRVYDALTEENKIEFSTLVKKYGCSIFISKLWEKIEDECR